MALITASALLSCGDTIPRTEAIVTIDADADLRASFDSLEIAVLSARIGEPLSSARVEIVRRDALPRWPYRLGLLPQGGDADREFEVKATLIGEMGALTGRVSGRYVAGRTIWLHVHLSLDHACRGAGGAPRMCEMGQTCCFGECVPARVPDPPDYDPARIEDPPLSARACSGGAPPDDAGPRPDDAGMDAGRPGEDAGPREDAGHPGEDAGPRPALRALEVSAGEQFSCARTETGAVLCWGSNRESQLGGVAGVGRPTPGPVPMLPGAVTAISAGGRHVCATFGDPAGLTCWGDNTSGQVGNDTEADAVARPFVVFESGVTAFGTGVSHSCAVVGGQTYCWGSNDGSQLGPMGDQDRCGVSLRANCARAPVEVPLLAVHAIDGGNGSTCAIHGDERHVSCWGSDADGQLGDGSHAVTRSSATPVLVGGSEPLVSVESITVGWTHACATRAGGELVCWGGNQAGQIGKGDSGASTRAHLPVTVSVGDTVGRVGAGLGHTCALTTVGIPWCWGANVGGQVGVPPDGGGAFRPEPSPVRVVGETSGDDIAAGGSHTCGIDPDEHVACWGLNNAGQLGRGTVGGATEAFHVPAPVLGMP